MFEKFQLLTYLAFGSPPGQLDINIGANNRSDVSDSARARRGDLLWVTRLRAVVEGIVKSQVGGYGRDAITLQSVQGIGEILPVLETWYKGEMSQQQCLWDIYASMTSI